jgi:hypothetical protein
MSALAEGLHKDDDNGPTEEVSIPGQADDNSCCVCEQLYVDSGNEKKGIVLTLYWPDASQQQQ